jgi:ABC-2 type transport system permease protein
MSTAVVRKTLRDTALLLVLLTAGIVVFNILAARMLVEAATELPLLRMWLDRPLVQLLVRMALGADMAGELTSTTLSTFALGHPLYYALAWTLLLTLATGAIAGEIGRGTADLLLTLPVSRVAVYVSVSVVLALAAVLVSGTPLLGLWLGQHVWSLAEPLDFHRLWPIPFNLLALNLCVAGVTLMVSSLVSRRGSAVGIVLAGILVSDLVNLLAQFWDTIRRISFLGFLHYYRPLVIARSGQLPLDDVAVLLSVAVCAWTMGLWRFVRRDIPAA